MRIWLSAGCSSWRLDLRQLDVFGNINPHRPGPAALGQGDGFFHDARQGLGIVYQVAVFHDAQVMPRMSVSWKASVPISPDGTCPVITSMGTESM